MRQFQVVDSSAATTEAGQPVFEAHERREVEGSIETAVALRVDYQYDGTLSLRPSAVNVRTPDGQLVAAMRQNFAQTKFEVEAHSTPLAELEFSWFSLKKGFGLLLGAKQVKVQLETPSEYRGVDDGGRTMVLIEAEKNILAADRWQVTFTDEVPAAVAVLCVVALRLRRD